MNIPTEFQNFPLIIVSNSINRANAIIPVKLQRTLYMAILILSDTAMTFLSFNLAYYFRFDLFAQYASIAVPLGFPKILVYPTSLLWIVVFLINGLYNKENLNSGYKEYSKVFYSVTEGFLLIVIAGFLDPFLGIERDWVLMEWVFMFILVSTARGLLRRIVYTLRRRGFFLTPAVIVGANQEGGRLAEQLMDWEKSGLHLVGFVDKKASINTFPLIHDLPLLGHVEQLGEIIERFKIGEVILASSAFSSRDYLLDIFRKYNVSDKINIRLSSGLYSILTTGLTVTEFASVPFVNVNKVRLTRTDAVIKAILDYALATLSLVALSPFLVLIAFLIKIASPGPIFYSRQVLGLSGKKYNVLKFRTMYTNGDEILEKHPELKEEFEKTRKLKDDPRVTPIGAILRKYSLDELPQLFNVLKGEMSMVGPRMIPEVEKSLYKQFDINLLTVLPGITGLWQVSGRSDVSYEERVQLDMYYIRNWSIWLDLQILLQTIPVVLTGHGAY